MRNYTAMIPYAGMIPVKNNSPVVFIHEGGPNNRTDLWPGIFRDGSIYFDERSQMAPVIRKTKPKSGTFFPVGQEYFHRISRVYQDIWDALDGASRDDSLLYQNCLPPIDDVADGKMPWAEYEAGMHKNEERVEEIDRTQREKGETIYRFIRHAVADGFAVYQVTGICGNLAKVKVCRGLGDDHVYYPYGESADIPLSEVEGYLSRHDEFLKRGN